MKHSILYSILFCVLCLFVTLSLNAKNDKKTKEHKTDVDTSTVVEQQKLRIYATYDEDNLQSAWNNAFRYDAKRGFYQESFATYKPIFEKDFEGDYKSVVDYGQIIALIEERVEFRNHVQPIEMAFTHIGESKGKNGCGICLGVLLMLPDSTIVEDGYVFSIRFKNVNALKVDKIEMYYGVQYVPFSVQYNQPMFGSEFLAVSFTMEEKDKWKPVQFWNRLTATLVAHPLSVEKMPSACGV